ncbi:putative protein TPRXL [Cheilinus undulatus]|uniref:putative protein TPRXL n=1 Tax=Cheilinus undulatus TaxID=241271 RepID=UPI001BD32931|nr:putative protein TPRXL [Cheilinus undulatus]
MDSSSSSSSSSTSAAAETPPPSSSSSPPPRLSLQSPQLQTEFFQECRRRFQLHSDVSEPGETQTPSSPLPSPFSPSPASSPGGSSSSSPCLDSRPVRLSLSSPELLSELKDSRSRTLRHVSTHNGLTTVFSGRGRGGQVSGSAPSTPKTNQRTSN